MISHKILYTKPFMDKSIVKGSCLELFVIFLGLNPA